MKNKKAFKGLSIIVLILIIGIVAFIIINANIKGGINNDSQNEEIRKEKIQEITQTDDNIDKINKEINDFREKIDKDYARIDELKEEREEIEDDDTEKLTKIDEEMGPLYDEIDSLNLEINNRYKTIDELYKQKNEYHKVID